MTSHTLLYHPSFKSKLRRRRFWAPPSIMIYAPMRTQWFSLIFSKTPDHILNCNTWFWRGLNPLQNDMRLMLVAPLTQKSILLPQSDLLKFRPIQVPNRDSLKDPAIHIIELYVILKPYRCSLRWHIALLYIITHSKVNRKWANFLPLLRQRHPHTHQSIEKSWITKWSLMRSWIVIHGFEELI